MAEGVPVLSLRMRDNLFIRDNGMDSIETSSQGSRDETIECDSGYIEDRFRVDRKKLEQMLQLVPVTGDEVDEGAEDFFQRVMEETNTQITWPSKLKIGAKSKKDPHIKVIGYPDNVNSAKNKIMTVLDTKSNRVTLKMDVSHTEHSHVIGKGGNNIKRVMTETNCHIHFPDSNRGNNNSEKSNQVSLAGQPDGVESARKQIRDLLPLVFMFDLPVTSPLTPVPDVNSPYIQQLQQAHSITINFKQRARTYSTTAIIRGSVFSVKGVQQATSRLMERLAGSASLPVSMQLEIAPQHHIFIIGRGGVNIKHIMQATGANILFPDPNTATQQRKGTVFITGTIDSVIMARQHLIGCLPLVLMFDVKESIELDQGRVTQLMEHLDVYISVKPKPRQPSKSVIVKSIERNAANMYLARQVLLGLKSDIKISTLSAADLKKDGGSLINPPPLSMAGIGVLGQSVLSVNTANFIISGHPTPSVITSPHYTTNHITPAPPWIHSAPSPTVYSPIMVVTPGTPSTLPVLDLVPSPHTAGTNGYHQDLTAITTASNTVIRVSTPLEQVGPPSNATSDSTSPPHSPPPCVSPITVGLCNAADLVKLQKDSTLGEVLSPKHSPNLTRSAVINNHLHQQHLQHQQQQQQQHQQYLSQQQQHQQQYFSHHHHHHQQQQQPQAQLPSQYHDDMSETLHSLKLLGLNKTSSLTQLSSLVQQSNPHHSPLFNGVGHSQLLLNGSQVRDSPSPPEHDLSEKLAPGIERKNSTSSLFSSPLQFGFDYEQKKLLALKAMQKKPEGESRIPTDIWSGMGFSKSMPESAIRDKLGQMGIGTRCMDSDIMGYESPRPEIDLTIDQDLWNDDPQPDRTPSLTSRLLNKAPGEYPSPRKKIHYGLSHSNHVDSASLPQNKSVWATKTDLAELFSALGLSKYTDLFQQQEIDLSTFLTLSDHDLRELGISTFGARRKMLLAIADLNKRRTLIPSPATKPDSPPSVIRSASSNSLRHSPVYPTGNSGADSSGGLLRGGGNSASELFPSPNPPSALMSARGGPGLGSSSGHW